VKLIINIFRSVLQDFGQEIVFHFILFFYCCTGWGYVVAFTKILTMCQIYHTWIHPLYCSSPSPLLPPLIPETVSTGIIFAFTYMCVHCLHNIHPPTPFPAISPFLPVPTAPLPPWAESVPPKLFFNKTIITAKVML
jgi:hypothetical protein